MFGMKMLEDSFSGEARFPTDSTFSLCSLISQASSLLSGVLFNWGAYTIYKGFALMT